MIRKLLPNTVVMILVGLLLNGCGGATVVAGTSGSSSTGSSSSSAPTLTISLQDSSGKTTSQITGNNPGTVVAQLNGAQGNYIVTFQTTAGQLNPTSANVLTDSSGKATIELDAGTVKTAGTVSATASVNGTSITSNSISFETIPTTVVSGGIQLGTCSGGSSPTDCTSSGTTFKAGTISVADPQISARGETELGLVVENSAGKPVNNVTVNFASQCTNEKDSNGNALASIQSGTSNINGIVKVAYQASGCTGADQITATEPSSGQTAIGTINILPPSVGSIVFDNVTDSAGNNINTIYIKGSGGDTTALVSFKVVDQFGNPVKGEQVAFELTTSIGGVSLQNTTAQTDSNGIATAFVDSGYIATTVRVRATVTTTSGPLVTLSDQLSINTGIADEDSMSLSSDKLNVEGADYDGSTTTITVRLADAFNNPVRDGTSVQFRTEYGSVTPSCTTTGGACSVTWTSQAPRGPLDPTAHVPLLGDGTCPDATISMEPVTITTSSSGALQGNTDYVISKVDRVETSADVALLLNTDYTVDSNGYGITCVTGSSKCVNGASLKITYQRKYLDEDNSGDTTHKISQPGVATPPYNKIVGVPCLAAGRKPTPEHAGYNGGLGQIYGGRSTVLAFAQGEESFTDSNGDGEYSVGEPFVDLPEAFLDTNEDNVFGNNTAGVGGSSVSNPDCYGPAAPLSASVPALDNCYQEGGDEDVFIDFNNNHKFDKGNEIYNGTLCPLTVNNLPPCNNNTGSNPIPCTSSDQYCTRTLVDIRRSIVILDSGSKAYMGLRDAYTGTYIAAVNLNLGVGNFEAGVAVTDNSGNTIPAGTSFNIGYGDNQVAPAIGQTVALTSGTNRVYVDLADKYNGHLPANTTIGVSSSNGCQITNTPPSTILSSDSFGGDTIEVDLGKQTSPATASAPVQITVTTPKNNVTTGSFTCSY